MWDYFWHVLVFFYVFFLNKSSVYHLNRNNAVALDFMTKFSLRQRTGVEKGNNAQVLEVMTKASFIKQAMVVNMLERDYFHFMYD